MSQRFDVDAAPSGLTEAQLVAAARGQHPGVDPASALKHLRALRSKELPRLVSEALAPGGRRDRRFRRTALQIAARLEGAEAERLLVAHLDDRDPDTLGAAALTLGRVGGPAALAALERVDAGDTLLAARVGFARTLLAHRHRIDRHMVEIPASGLRVILNRARAKAVTAKPVSLTREEIAQLQAAAMGVAVEGGKAVEFTCGANKLLLVAAAGFTTAAQWATLATQPGVPLLTFRRDLSLDEPVLIEYFLARPGNKPGEIALVSVHSQGGAAYTGTARRSGATIDFEIQAVAGPYAAPVLIEGSVDPAELEIKLNTALSEQIIDQSGTGRRRPRPAQAG